MKRREMLMAYDFKVSEMDMKMVIKWSLVPVQRRYWFFPSERQLGC
jgi:hypothetical protein